MLASAAKAYTTFQNGRKRRVTFRRSDLSAGASKETKDAKEAEDKPPLLPLGYLYSVSQPGRFRCLHYAGARLRLPFVHFLRWEDLGSEEPDLSRIDARSSDCLPAPLPDLQHAEEAAKSEEGGSSTASSSSSSAPEGEDEGA